MPKFPASTRQVSAQPAMQREISGGGFSAPGRAMQGLGRAISSAGNQIAGAFEDENKKLDDFNYRMATTKFSSDAWIGQDKLDAGITDDGRNHVTNSLAEYDKRASDYVASVPKRKQQEALLNVQRIRGGVERRSTGKQRSNGQDWYNKGLLNTFAKSVLPGIKDLPSAAQGMKTFDAMVDNTEGLPQGSRLTIKKQIGGLIASHMYKAGKPQAALDYLDSGTQKKPAASVDYKLPRGVSQKARAGIQTLGGQWAAKYGKPFSIKSSYRDPKHNKRVGGARGSQHVHGRAFDVSTRGWSQDQKKDFIRMAGSQGFKGFGVGSTSIHVDMGGSRSWGYAGGVSSGKGPAPLWARGAIKDAHRGGGGSTRSTYSAQDKDFMIRTMLGEAGAESDEGLAGVAAVLRNRVEHGDFGGRTGKDVSLAKNQFETWQKHGARLKRISKSSPEYKRAQNILEGILQGQTEDPTGGAYYFVSGGIRTPSTKNPTRRIGGHEFFIGPGGKAHVSQAGGQSVALNSTEDFFRAALAKNRPAFEQQNVKLLKEQQKTAQAVGTFRSVMEGTASVDPNDKNVQKFIDLALEKTEVIQGFAKGEPQAAGIIITASNKLGYVPASALSVVRAAIINGKPEEQQKSLIFLGQIEQKAPMAYAGIKDKKLLFEAEYFNRGLAEGREPEALQEDIAKFRTPEWKEKWNVRAKDATEWLKSNQLSESDLLDAKDSWYSDGPDELGATPMRGESIMSYYNELVKRNFVEIGDGEKARTLAIETITKEYGMSEVTGTDRLMRYPPEKYYEAVGVTSNEFSWQLQGYVSKHMDIEDPEDVDMSRVYIQPTAQTELDIKTPGALPSYQVLYKDDHGRIQAVTGGQFYAEVPDDVKKAQEGLSTEEHIEKHKGEKASKQIELEKRDDWESDDIVRRLFRDKQGSDLEVFDNAR